MNESTSVIYKCGCGHVFEVSEETDTSQFSIECPQCDCDDDLVESSCSELIFDISSRIAVLAYVASNKEWGDIKKLVKNYDHARKRELDFIKQSLNSETDIQE